MILTRGNRIVRSRGRRALPPDVVYVGRPTHRANPFAGRQWGHAKSVLLHRRWLHYELGALTLEKLGFCPAEIDALDRLRTRVFETMPDIIGSDLACWCPASSRWCHADTLLDMTSVLAARSRRVA